MENNIKESQLAKINPLVLCIIVLSLSIISSFVFEYTNISDNTDTIISWILFVGIIPVACFIITMIHPKSFKYAPFLCNPVAFLGTIFHPFVWTTLLEYLLWVISLVLTILAAYIGAKIGRRKINQT